MRAFHHAYATARRQSLVDAIADGVSDGSFPATVDPGANSGDKPLLHTGEELVFTLEGSLVFDIAGTRHEVGPGDALHFMGDQPHHWVNEGESAARALWVALRDS